MRSIIFFLLIGYTQSSKLIEVEEGSGEIVQNYKNTDVFPHDDEMNLVQQKLAKLEWKMDEIADKLEKMDKKNIRYQDTARVAEVKNLKRGRKLFESNPMPNTSLELWIVIAVHLATCFTIMLGILLLSCKKTGIELHTAPITLNYPNLEVNNYTIETVINILHIKSIAGTTPVSGKARASEDSVLAKP